MTLVTGTVQDLGHAPMDGTLYARPARFLPAGNVVYAPERTPYKIEGGTFSVELAPGPAVLELKVGTHARDEFRVVIPDQETIGLATLIAEVFPWQPEQVSKFVAERKRAEKATADAVTAAGAAETAAGTAATAAQQTGQDRTRVDQVRSELEEAYDASEAGQALPPRLTEAALSATYGTKGELAQVESDLDAAKLDKAEAATTYATPAQAGAIAGDVVPPLVPPLVADALASDDTVAQAAATAAQGAMSAAGVRTFYAVAGAPLLMANPEFATEPSYTTPQVTGNWYNVGSPAREWVQITDGPNGPQRVIRFTEPNLMIRQIRPNLGADGLAGKEVTLRFVARALAANGETVAPLRVLVERTGWTIFSDLRINSFGTEWGTYETVFTIPADIGSNTIRVSVGVSPNTPGSGQAEIASIRAFVSAEDIPTVVSRQVVSSVSGVVDTVVAGAVADAVAGIEIPPTEEWAPDTEYVVGQKATTPLGHTLVCREAHTSRARFTDDLPKWRPVGAPPNEPMLLGRSSLGHGQAIGIGNRIAIALRYDDWHTAFRDNVLPLMQERGIPSGLATISNLPAQSWTSGVTTTEVKDWNRQGVEICSHGLDHKDPSPHDLMGAGGLYEQIVGSKATIESWGIHCRGWMQPGATPLVAGVTPYGTAWTNWDALDGYAAWLIRDTYPVSLSDVWGRHQRPLPNRMMHGGSHITISDGMAFTDVMNTLNGAIVGRRSLSLMIHSGNIDKPGNITLAEFTQVLDWLATKRAEGLVEILTPTGLCFAEPTTARAVGLRNGGFDGATYWSGVGGTRTIETGAGRTAPGFARFGASEAGLLTQNIAQLPDRGWAGHTFMFEGYARATSATTTARVTVSGGDLALDKTRAGIGTEWTPVYVPFSAPPDASTITVGIGRGGGSGIEWDDVSVHPV